MYTEMQQKQSLVSPVDGKIKRYPDQAYLMADHLDLISSKCDPLLKGIPAVSFFFVCVCVIFVVLRPSSKSLVSFCFCSCFNLPSPEWFLMLDWKLVELSIGCFITSQFVACEFFFSFLH